jgi:hypothetical protein
VRCFPLSAFICFCVRARRVMFAHHACVAGEDATSGGGRFPYSLPRATLVGAGLFAFSVSTYNGLCCLSEHVRGKDDWVNAGIAGFFSAHILSDRMVRAEWSPLVRDGCGRSGGASCRC